MGTRKGSIIIGFMMSRRWGRRSVRAWERPEAVTEGDFGNTRDGDPSLLTSAPTKGNSSSVGRMVFMPHGMDQMFYQPQSSLFPELKGVVATAVLETPEAREPFRE